MKFTITFTLILLLSFSTGFAQEVTTLTTITANGGISVKPNGEIIVSHFGPLPFVTGQEGRNIYSITPEGDVSLFAENVVRVGTGNTIDSQGNIYQGSFQENKVIKLDSDGNVIDNNFAAANGAVGVLAIENDTILVCSCGTNSVLKVAQDGSSSVFASGPEFNCPNGITKDEQGIVYVSNFSDGRVTKITRNGTATTLGNTGSSSGGHVAFRHVDQMLYLTSYQTHRLYKMDLSGNSTPFAGTGASGAMDAMDAMQATFAKPNGLEFSPNGCSLYITQDEDVLREILFTDGVCDNTGFEDIDLNPMFNVYPNPARERFTVENESSSTIQSIQLVGLSGRMIISWNQSINSEYVLPVTLNAGIYFLKLYLDNSETVLVKKMVINR